MPALCVNASGQNSLPLPSPADCIDYTARMIYTLLYRLAHGDGYHGRAFVSIPALATMRGVSVSTMDKALSRLRRNSWIHTSRRKAGLLITPLVKLAQRDFVYLEDHRNAPARDTPFSPAPVTHFLRISSSSAADSYIRKNKSIKTDTEIQQTPEQERTNETNTVTAPAKVVVSMKEKKDAPITEPNMEPITEPLAQLVTEGKLTESAARYLAKDVDPAVVRDAVAAVKEIAAKNGVKCWPALLRTATRERYKPTSAPEPIRRRSDLWRAPARSAEPMISAPARVTAKAPASRLQSPVGVPIGDLALLPAPVRQQILKRRERENLSP